MLSRSPLLKARNFVLQSEEAVVIDSNERMAAKIEELASSLESLGQEEIESSFTEGIEATQVAALLAEDDGSNVIHPQTEAVYEGPAPSELLEQAQAEIEEMRSRAEAEMVQLRNQTLQEAQDRGQKEGFDQGYQEGLRRAQAEYDDRNRELREKEARLLEEYERRISEMEPTLVDALTNIYAHVFKVELSSKRDVIMHLIENTLHRVDGCENYLIRVSREDFPFVSMQKQSVLEKCVMGSAKLEVVEDVTLAANECLIETDSGIYDCSVGTELEELKKQLMLLSYQD